MLETHSFRGAATLAALLFSAGALAFFALRSPSQPSPQAGQFKRDTLELVTAGGTRRIDVEVAETIAEQAQGLMYRTSLPDTQGMLFLHKKPGEVRMWMRNTYIPLDMVFIRAGRHCASHRGHDRTAVRQCGALQRCRYCRTGAERRSGRSAGPQGRRQGSARVFQAAHPLSCPPQ